MAFSKTPVFSHKQSVTAYDEAGTELLTLTLDEAAKLESGQLQEIELHATAAFAAAEVVGPVLRAAEARSRRAASRRVMFGDFP